MLLLTKYGCFSVTRKQPETALERQFPYFIVGAKVARDLETLKERAQLDNREIVKNRKMKDPFYIEVPIVDLRIVLKVLGDSIDYHKLREELSRIPEQEERTWLYYQIEEMLKGLDKFNNDKPEDLRSELDRLSKELAESHKKITGRG